MRAPIVFLTIILILFLGCLTPTDHRVPDQPITPQPPVSPPTQPSPPGGLGSFPYTVSELKSGNIDKILHCGGPLWVEGTEYEAYVQAFPNHQPLMIVHFFSLVPPARFTSGMDDLKKDVAKHPTTIPFLSFQYSYDEGGDPIAYDKEVAEGEFDSEIRELAQYVKSLNKPVFFRPGFEFNGWWNGFSKQYYAKSFQRIHSLFQEEGATNAIFVWTYEPTGGNEPYMDFYPGDAYVDWWGIDLFGLTFSDDKANALTTQFIKDAGTHGKPVIFPESAPAGFNLDSQTTWNEWFAPYFQLMKEYSHVKGFCYTNHDFIGTAEGWGDMRIDQSSLSDEWLNEISKPIYVHQE